MRVVFPEGFSDGNLSADFEKLGHSPIYGIGEIADLPETVLEKVKRSGGVFTTNPDEISQAQSRQGTHIRRENEWVAKRAKSDVVNKERVEKKEMQRQMKAKIELDALRARLPLLYGREERIVWRRIQDLEASLK